MRDPAPTPNRVGASPCSHLFEKDDGQSVILDNFLDDFIEGDYNVWSSDTISYKKWLTKGRKHILENIIRIFRVVKNMKQEILAGKSVTTS